MEKLEPDFKDLLTEFAKYSVRYLLLGGYAVGFHGYSRATKDLDIWIDGRDENLDHTATALRQFGVVPSVVEDLKRSGPKDIVWIGVPPLRIDFLRSVPGLGAFEDCYSRRVESTWDGVPIVVLSKEDLLRSKRAAGRKQDLLDIEKLSR